MGEGVGMKEFSRKRFLESLEQVLGENGYVKYGERAVANSSFTRVSFCG